MQNEGYEIFMNETKFEDDVMEEKKLNPNSQTKGSRIPKTDEKKLKCFLEPISLSKSNGNHIIGIFKLVFFLLRIIQKLHLMHLKLCVVPSKS